MRAHACHCHRLFTMAASRTTSGRYYLRIRDHDMHVHKTFARLDLSADMHQHQTRVYIATTSNY